MVMLLGGRKSSIVVTLFVVTNDPQNNKEDSMVERVIRLKTLISWCLLMLTLMMLDGVENLLRTIRRGGSDVELENARKCDKSASDQFSGQNYFVDNMRFRTETMILFD